MNKLPLARSADVVIQKLDSEVLIYDLRTNKAYNLNETSAIVYQSCDGKTSFDELRSRHQFTDDLIFLALDELKKENLIEDDKTLVSPHAGMSRREVIRRAGLGTMIALPLISSLVAPTAAMAQSQVACIEGNSCDCASATNLTNGTCPDGGGCGSGCECRVLSCFAPEVDSFFCVGTCQPPTV